MSKNQKERTRIRANREHIWVGGIHWHVRKRSSVVVCGNCGEQIPKWKNPKLCPECKAGKIAKTFRFRLEITSQAHNHSTSPNRRRSWARGRDLNGVERDASLKQ